MLPGVVRRTMTDGEHMMLCEVRLDAGAVVPLHTHPHEQTGYLVFGRGRFQVDREQREMKPGDSWLIPSDIPHEFTALEDTVVIEVFAPPRQDYRNR